MMTCVPQSGRSAQALWQLSTSTMHLALSLQRRFEQQQQEQSVATWGRPWPAALVQTVCHGWVAGVVMGHQRQLFQKPSLEDKSFDSCGW